MVKACCITNCKNMWTKNGTVTFHSFPRDPESLKTFTSAIPPNFIPKITKYSYICSKHFTDDSYHPVTFPCFRHRLKTKAIPTLFSHDYDLSVTATATDEIQLPIDDTDMLDDMDNQLIIESIPSDFIENTALCQKNSTNNNLAHVEILEQNPDTSPIINKQDIGVQTFSEDLAPSREMIKLRNRIRVLRKRLLRRDIRIRNTRDSIRRLNKSDKCTEAAGDTLKSHFSGFSVDILNNELQNSSATSHDAQYSEKIKNFASTLYFYSPKAYNFLRTKLSLPHSSLLRKWLNADNS